MYRQIAFPLVPPALPTIARLTFISVWNGSFVPLGYLAPLRDYQTLTSALIRYSKQFQTLYPIMAHGACGLHLPAGDFECQLTKESITGKRQ